VAMRSSAVVLNYTGPMGPDGAPVLDSSQRLTLRTMLDGQPNKTTSSVVTIPTNDNKYEGDAVQLYIFVTAPKILGALQ
jgi:hypothetical protein